MEEEVIKLEPKETNHKDIKWPFNVLSFETPKDDIKIKDFKLIKEELKPEIQSINEDNKMHLLMTNDLKVEKVDHFEKNNKQFFNKVMKVEPDHDCKPISDTSLPLIGGSGVKVKTEDFESADDKNLVHDCKPISDTSLPLIGGSGVKVKTEDFEGADDKNLVHDCKPISDTSLPLICGSSLKVKTEDFEGADDKNLDHDLKKLIKSEETKSEFGEISSYKMFEQDSINNKNCNFHKTEFKNTSLTNTVADDNKSKEGITLFHDNWSNIKVKKDLLIKTSDGTKLDRHFTEAIKGIFSGEETFEVDTVDLENVSSIPQALLTSITDTGSSKKKKYRKELKFVCSYCGRRFTQTDVLRQHMRVHTGEKPHICKFCDKSFRTKHLRNLHSQIHTGKRHECTFCFKRFTTRYLVRQHELLHKGIKNFKCTKCKTTFHRKDCLVKHVSNVNCSEDKDQTLFNKLLKNASFRSKQSPKIPPKVVFMCDDCGKSFTLKTSLMHHVQNVHLKEISYHHCKICNKKFVSKSNCRKHEKLHENVHPYSCEVCGLSFKEKGTLINHINSVHLNYKPYKCKLCNSSFENKANLTSHNEVHHNSNKTNKYFCKTCDAGFYRLVYLRRHMHIHNGSDKKFICDYCGMRCRSKKDIERHIYTHIGGRDKTFQCEVCGKAFGKQSHHRRHLLVHSDDRPFKCKLCDKTYRDPGSLQLHQNVHTKKTYTCDSCGFVSINERSFKRHMSKTCKKET